MTPLFLPRLIACAGALVSAASAHALSPTEVFEKVSPSVWTVRALDVDEQLIGFGSGVVFAQGQIITNCHVLTKAKAVQVRREAVTYDATLEHADAERDLCILKVPQLPAPAVKIAPLSTLKVGHRAYVVGNPEGLTLTLSEGLISGLRTEDPTLPPIQTTAPVSPGSSGGGLFDEQARLVGITTLIVVGRLRIAQNLNFAVPAEWIGEVPERAKQQLARLRERTKPPVAKAPSSPATVAAMPGMPTVGDVWKYSFRDQKYGLPERFFTARVTAVNGSTIDELIRFEGATEIAAAADAENLRFVASTAPDLLLVELSPYLVTGHRSDAAGRTFGVPSDYPIGISGERFQMRLESVDQEEIVVPFGRFKTVRVVVSGQRSGTDLGAVAGIRFNPYFVARFRYTAWYAPEVARYVKARHMQWNQGGELTGDEIVQLLEYSKN